MSVETERGGLPIRHFADQKALERWLARQPAEHKGIWLKIAKKDRGLSSVTVSEAIDVGLCFGWIDGLINRFDEDYFLIRYTPRRPRSKWSQINVERAEALLTAGKVKPGGLKQIEAAKADGRWDAAYPPASRMEVPEDLAAALEANSEAGTFFATLAGVNRYAILYRLHDVRGSEKRRVAIGKWIAALARGKTVYGDATRPQDGATKPEGGDKGRGALAKGQTNSDKAARKPKTNTEKTIAANPSTKGSPKRED